MAETYSLSITGQSADALPSPIKDITIGDSGAQLGSQARNMQLGQQVLCKNPDGSLAWYTMDAERSTPANPVLRQVSP